MTPLTDQQRRVASRIAQGMTDKAIAGELHVSPRRVRRIIAQIAKHFEIGRGLVVRVEIAKRMLGLDRAA